MPSFSDIPTIVANIRHPRRRAISVGPQSEADAYETLAYREKRRRDSLSSPYRGSPVTDNHEDASTSATALPKLSRKTSKLDEYEHMMGRGTTAVERSQSPEGTEPFPEFVDEERVEEELFAQIKRPRVRYDVEVITKLVVYSGRHP